MQNEKINIGELILQTLKEKERSIVWLAKKVGCDDSNLGKTLKNSRYIYIDLLFRISVALEEDFFEFFSKKLKEDQR
ncbi:XRE family transcriptional regulator [Odoribacter sp. OttesenSCG-928-L07]|nr:XRE family transcriptional regulator [Odoribacter sp. OttesenSCG-928-L07]MDL2238669.1 XRE family transcriptional regulator [Bacteroidales bacterium OttesenSCG-928-L14]